MRSAWSAACAVAVGIVIGLGAGVASAQTPADPVAVEKLMKSLIAPGATEPPRVRTSADGYVVFLGAPPSGHFQTDASAKQSSFFPDDVAVSFLQQNAAAFGAQGVGVFTPKRIVGHDGRNYVHLKQVYQNLPVYGAGAMVQVAQDGGVAAVSADFMRQDDQLASLSITPVVDAANAAARARELVSAVYNLNTNALDTTDPVLMVYDPAIGGRTGEIRLIWKVEVVSLPPLDMTVREKVLVDALDGTVVRNTTLLHTALDRRVYDSQGLRTVRQNLVRGEGDPPTGDQDVDDVYEMVGDTYEFFSDVHGIDSIDRNGAPIHAQVNFDVIPNAFFIAFEEEFGLFFGPGYVTDDVVAHEYTHGVTHFASQLEYEDESGAIHEALADIWGEFVDFAYQSGSSLPDTPAVRWLHREDYPFGPNRSLKNPSDFGWFPDDFGGQFLPAADRYTHPAFYRGELDNGGVHFNSGVGNKLGYLLTDGDFFNEIFINGLGEIGAAKLLFEVQQNLLNSSAGYLELGDGLVQAGVNLGLSTLDRADVINAIRAVEIVQPGTPRPLADFRAIPAQTNTGLPVIVLAFDRPDAGVMIDAIVRNQVTFPKDVNDGKRVTTTNELLARDLAVDGLSGDLIEGEEYLYTIFWRTGNNAPGVSYARAVAGAEPPDLLAEAFSGNTGAPFDLSFSQLLFSPSFDALRAIESEVPRDFVGIGDYSVSITPNVGSLPVPQVDDQGAAAFLDFTDDGIITFDVGDGVPLPFFGALFRSVSIGANGYIDFGEPCIACPDNFPSLAAATSNFRVSVLAADLNPRAGGAVWVRSLDDRLVVTYENVPEDVTTAPGPPRLNTAQAELFYSGHIRLTYLNVQSQTAVVGVSDARGLLVDPSTVLPQIITTIGDTDFSQAPVGVSEQFLLWPPVPVQVAVEGEVIRFTVRTQTEAGTATPTLFGTWNLEEPVPFSDNGDGTGTFLWRTERGDAGEAVVQLVARQGDKAASQSVRLFVADASAQPEARNLELLTAENDTNGDEPREVSDSANLTAQYEYTHPQLDTAPQTAAEGNTQIRWFRNGAEVFPLRNATQVPAQATTPGDQWFFTVQTETALGVRGPLQVSPTVTIVEGIVVDSVSPSNGAFLGGDTITIRGSGLSNTIAVLFGAVVAPSVTVRSDAEIVVVTPMSAPGTVDIRIDTPTQSHTLPSAFTFTTTEDVRRLADVNGDDEVDALDIRLVARAVLAASAEKGGATDVNKDGKTDASDLQIVLNAALTR